MGTLFILQSSTITFSQRNMKQQKPYNIYLDYKGYMLDSASARIAAAPMMGNVFSTGRSNYSDLDFWQVGACTDFSHGLNQKFIVDTSSYYYSEGIDISKPGEIKVERDLRTDSLPLAPESGWGTVTATYKSATALWIGTSLGYVFYKTSGGSWTREPSISADGNKIYDFFEIKNPYGDGNVCLFVTKGPYIGYVRVGTSGAFVQIAPDLEWAVATTDMDELPLGATVSGTTYSSKVTQSFIVNNNTTFKKIAFAYKTVGSYAGSITITIRPSDPVTGEPKTDSIFSTTFNATAGQTTMTWKEYALADANYLNLKRCTKYFFEVSAAGISDSSYPVIGITIGPDSYYEGDILLKWNSVSSTWDIMERQEQMCFRFYSDLKSNIYYVDSNSNYIYGWVEDGIKSTTNGMTWTPDNNSGLWTLPANQGTALSVSRTVRGLLVGATSSLWIFLGGTSGVSLWNFPENPSSNNFKGMHQCDQLSIFSVENEGLFYTDGSTIAQTNIHSSKEGFIFESCAGITSSGNDAFALIKNTSGDWYLARTNSYYTGTFKYWWIVKKLAKTPVNIAALDNNTIQIFYSDQTVDKYEKNGPYQDSGYLETSLFDAELVKLDKMFRSIDAIFEPFPTGTSAKLSYRTSINSTYSDSSIFTSGPYISYALPNPTVSNRLQSKVTLYSNTANTISPVLTDLTWTYILQRSNDTNNTLKTFYLTILCEDDLQTFTGDLDNARTSKDITNELWTISQKKQILNYIGIDNVCENALKIVYSGATGKTITIDRTNFLLTISGSTLSYNYYNKTLADIAAQINALANFTCTVHPDVDSTRTAHDLEPISLQTIIIGEQYLNVGSDVHAVLMNTNSPTQTVLSVDGRGSDRIQIALREVAD